MCIHICVCVCTCVRVFMCVCVSLHTHVHLQITHRSYAESGDLMSFPVERQEDVFVDVIAGYY